MSFFRTPLLYLLVTLFFFTLFSLALARGHYVVGWELLGIAEGIDALEGQTFWEALAAAFRKTRHFQYWNQTNSVLYSLLPALLYTVWPWYYWAQLLTLLSCLVTLIALARFFQVPLSLLFGLMLSSPVLLSHSILGYPYLSLVLPYSLTLMLLLASRQGRVPIWLEIILWLLITELSIHCYELGKTFFIPLILGALLFREISIYRRGAWLLSGCLLGAYLRSLGGSNIESQAEELSARLADLPLGAWRVVEGYIPSFYLDAPYLLLLSGLSLIALKKDKLFWIALLGMNFALLAWGAASNDFFLMPRRSLLLTFTFLLVCFAAWDELSLKKTLRGVFLSVLSLSLVSTLFTTREFILSSPSDQSLPYTLTYDFSVPRSLVDDAERIASISDTLSGRLVIFYGYSFHAENSTIPAALPERLYVLLGPEKFKRQIQLIDILNCRYTCIETTVYKQMNELPSLEYENAFVLLPKPDMKSRFQRTSIKEFLFNKSVLEELPSELKHFTLYFVRKYVAPDPLLIEPLKTDKTYKGRRGFCAQTRQQASLLGGLPEEFPSGVEFLPSPLNYKTDISETKRFSANFRARDQETLLFDGRVDDEMVIRLNNQELYSILGPNDITPFSFPLRVAPGDYELEVFYSNDIAAGVFELSIRGEGGEPELYCRQ